MRITKKFTGESSIGKRVFHPCDDEEAVERSRREIAHLESAWRSKLESQRRDQSSSGRSKPTNEDDDCRKRRLDAQAASQLETWLERARNILEAKSANVDDVDAVVADGEHLRAHLAQDEPKKQAKFNVKDEEATSLLVDFLRSAQKGARQEQPGDDDQPDEQRPEPAEPSEHHYEPAPPSP